MSDGDIFFVMRDGVCWACWLGDRPSVKMGPADEVLAAMEKLLEQQDSSAPATQTSSTAPLQPPPVVERQRIEDPPPAPRTAPDRAEMRHPVTITGKVRTTSGSREVVVRDLSTKGCQFEDVWNNLNPGTQLTVQIGPISPIGGSVKWRRGKQVGVAFDSPLYPSVMEHIRDHFGQNG